METKRPLILISNDDGYHAKGINSLIDMVDEFGDIIVCAPESGRSGFSCAFSVSTPLTLKLRRKREGMEMWSCNGTPVDCVKLALDQLCKDRWPAMVIGGINHGDNASVNSHYSGTMGVVLEGCMKYIPSVAFSLCDHSDDADFEPMRGLVKKVTKYVLDNGLPRGTCLNVNYPLVEKCKGVKVCRMAMGRWGNEVVTNHHPRGYDYYWLTGSYTNDEPEDESTDNWALTHGYAAITPTTIDETDYSFLKELTTHSSLK